MKTLIIISCLLLATAAAADDYKPDWVEQITGYRKRPPKPRIIYVEPAPVLQPNGSYYTDEQLAESNKTRYNASGKQQVQRYIEAWRSPLQRYYNRPGVYGSGYLGPLPQGPTDQPYCPPGYNCFKIDRDYRSDSGRRRSRP